jgi:hypothetical protein
MEGVWRYVCLDVGLTAGLPVALAYLLRFSSGRRPDLYEFLGDAQLCFFAATLVIIAGIDVALNHKPAVLAWPDKAVALFVLGHFLILAVVVWAEAVGKREITGPARRKASELFTWISLAVAVATATWAGISRYAVGLM